jgi:hypothetical protein
VKDPIWVAESGQGDYGLLYFSAVPVLFGISLDDDGRLQTT